MALGLKFPQTTDEKYKGSVLFSTNNGNRAGGAPGVGGGAGGPVILYLPEGINFSDGIVYDNANLNLAGEAARIGASTLKNEGVVGTVNKVLQQISEATTSAGSLGNVNALKNLTDNGLIAANLLAQTIAPDDIADGISAGTGITANPHKRSLFRDVTIRNFTFTFLMSPSTAAEASAIRNIVNFFRTNAYPEKIGDGLAYKFPTTFNIRLFYNNKPMEDAPKILPCYLTSVNTVLNPRSSSFFKDGRVNETQLSLNFMEERPLDKSEIREGF